MILKSSPSFEIFSSKLLLLVFNKITANILASQNHHTKIIDIGIYQPEIGPPNNKLNFTDGNKFIQVVRISRAYYILFISENYFFIFSISNLYR